MRAAIVVLVLFASTAPLKARADESDRPGGSTVNGRFSIEESNDKFALFDSSDSQFTQGAEDPRDVVAQDPREADQGARAGPLPPRGNVQAQRALLTAASVVRGLHLAGLMWILLGILLVVGWLLLKLVWNVAAFGLHLLLVGAAIAVVVHFVRGRVGRDSSTGS